MLALIINIAVAFTGLSFLVSLLSFKWDYPVHLKMFSLLLGLTFIVEVFATQIVKFFHWGNNSAVYNSFTLIEFSAYAFYYYRIIQVVWIRKLITVFIIVFPFFWFITVFYGVGINKWNNNVMILGGVFTVFFVLGYYYQILQSRKDLILFSHPEFWIATGMLLYYSCEIPYFGALNYLNKKNISLASSLLCVIDIIDILMYLLFIYAFICPITLKTHRKFQ